MAGPFDPRFKQAYLTNPKSRHGAQRHGIRLDAPEADPPSFPVVGWTPSGFNDPLDRLLNTDAPPPGRKEWQLNLKR